MVYYQKNKEALMRSVKKLLEGKVLLAFSGGVDSALLLKLFCANRKNKDDIKAVFFKSLSTSEGDLANAIKLAKEMDVDLLVKDVDVFSDQRIRQNKKDRCYVCKTLLFEQTLKIKEKLSYSHVVDGTNIDDYKVYRPGLTALKDLKIVSPLKDAGFSKQMIRDFAQSLGISVAKRPASPCLLTRFPYDTEITSELLRKVEDGENFLKNLGFSNLRLRVHDKILRLELSKSDFPKAILLADEICKYLKSLGFSYVSLDLEAFRSGSMDEVLADEEKKKWEINE